MSTVVRIPLSASTNGKLIAVGAVGTPGTPIHSAAGGSTQDFITLFANNTSSGALLLTLEVGGTTAADLKKVTVPGHAGDMTILDRKLLGSSFVLAGFGGASAHLNLDGYVDRVS